MVFQLLVKVKGRARSGGPLGVWFAHNLEKPLEWALYRFISTVDKLPYKGYTFSFFFVQPLSS